MTATTSVPFVRAVKQGDTGPDIVAIKRALIKAGKGDGLNDTDQFGAGLTTQLKAFQAMCHIPATGEYGTATHGFLAPYFDAHGVALLTEERKKLAAPVAAPVEQSKDGARFLEAWEGVELAPYNDSRGYATTGVGHLLHYSNVTAQDRSAGVTLCPGVVTGPGGSLTVAEALVLEQYDVDRCAIVALRSALKVPLEPFQIDALCSLAFNCGPGSLSPAGVVMTAVNSRPTDPAGDEGWYGRVEAAFMEWANPAVLERRRQSEAALFSTGHYTRATGNQYANS